MTLLDLLLIIVSLWGTMILTGLAFFLYRGWQRRRSAPARASKGTKDLYPQW